MKTRIVGGSGATGAAAGCAGAEGAGVAAWVYLQGIKLSGLAKTSAKVVAMITVFQIFLGIATLLLMAPELLAAAHQVTAALLLCAAVWHAYELRVYPQT